LTAGNTGLRGNESSKRKNGLISEGNSIRTVKLMADFDPVLCKLLNDEKLKIKYLSWKIQNEVIDVLASEIRSILTFEVINIFHNKAHKPSHTLPNVYVVY